MERLLPIISHCKNWLIDKIKIEEVRFLLKTNQIILIKHIERLPYELREITIQGVYSNEQQSDSEVRLC